MANVYVWSVATGAGTGADWANAYITLGAACTAKLAGDIFFVAHDHAETAAAITTITVPGTEASPTRIYCVDRAGSVPPISADLRTTATISTTGNSQIGITGTIAECYGIVFSAGDLTGNPYILLNSSGATNRYQRYVNCSFRLLQAGPSSRINACGQLGCWTVWENCTVQFSSATQLINTTGGRFIWRNTPNAIVAGGVTPSIFLQYAGSGAQIFLEGVDLSTINTQIIQTSTNFSVYCTLKDCKFAPSVAITTFGSFTGVGSPDLRIIRCDGGDTNYRTERWNWMGTMTTETVIVRTGGATDGGTPISWKIVTTANPEWEYPFECLPITIWNETVGTPITITLQGIWGTASTPLNTDIWIDVEYLGTSGFPLGSTATSSKATGLDAGTNLPAGSGVWGGSTNKFAMPVTITPREKGPLTIYVRASRASTTFYIDPKPIVT